MSDPLVMEDSWFHVRSDGFDPGAPELSGHFRPEVLGRVNEWLVRGSQRGRTEWGDDYLLVLFVVPVLDRESVTVWTRQIMMLATRDAVLTIDKTDDGHPPVDPAPVLDRLRASADRRTGRLIALIMDAVATAFVRVVDRFEDRANWIEELLEDTSPHSRDGGAFVRDHLKELRTSLFEARRAMMPTMEAVRQVVSGADLAGEELFPHDIEQRLRDTLDSLLYASESFEGIRDEVVSLRDYLQARIANEQNEIMKTLTIVAALVLVPTFIVGFFGQNFIDMPGLHDGFWVAVGVMSVIVGLEVVFLWWRGWIGNRGNSAVDHAMRTAISWATSPLRSGERS